MKEKTITRKNFNRYNDFPDNVYGTGLFEGSERNPKFAPSVLYGRSSYTQNGANITTSAKSEGALLGRLANAGGQGILDAKSDGSIMFGMAVGATLLWRKFFEKRGSGKNGAKML